MQLCITERTRSADCVHIHDTRILSQLQTVLRAKSGYIFCIQDPQGNERHEVCLDTINKKELTAHITKTHERTNAYTETTLYIALPNKHKKIEIIVQKLAEIGTRTIVFRKSHRSQLSEISPQKIERLNLIACEATEQSRNRYMPHIRICENIAHDIQQQSIIVFDTDTTILAENLATTHIGFVGPEGGRDAKDYDLFAQAQHTYKQSLGTSILRTETASIIAARWMQNR